jgi:transcriptional regulator with XRE-family HTH domain
MSAKGRKEARMSLAEAIKRIRLQQGMTQSDVGVRSGLATSYVSRLENGRIQPTTGTMDKLAAALGVSLSEIFAIPKATPHPGHRCPVSNSGQCIGGLMREGSDEEWSQAGQYSEEELHLLRMADFLIHNADPEVRQALKTMLEALMKHASSGKTSGRSSGRK